MEIHRFLFFAALASALWVTIFLGAGYWFGTAPWVQDYLALALVVIVVASALPGLIIWAVHRLRRARGCDRGEARDGGPLAPSGPTSPACRLSCRLAPRGARARRRPSPRG